MQESNSLTLSPGLLQEYDRLKVIGRFSDEQSLLKAAFEALDRELYQRDKVGSSHTAQPYMSHPWLSPDDYDT